MNKTLKSRLNRLEQALQPRQEFPVYIMTYARQIGAEGESIRDETDEQAIARHLAEHPEDAGKAFDFLIMTFVSPLPHTEKVL